MGHSSQLQQAARAAVRRKRVRPDAISHTERSVVRASIVPLSVCCVWEFLLYVVVLEELNGLITKIRTDQAEGRLASWHCSCGNDHGISCRYEARYNLGSARLYTHYTMLQVSGCAQDFISASLTLTSCSSFSFSFLRSSKA